MKGNVQLKDTQQTYDMLDKCYVVVSKLSLDDMRTITETSYKWSWDKLWFVKEEKSYPVANFLYQHKQSVIKFIKELKDCIKQNGIKFKTWNDEDAWYSINDGEYYTTDHSSLYRLSDWSRVDTDEAYEIVKNAKIELSEDPKKVHWEHFLKLEMIEKKAREKRMHEFVDSVLSKQVKYNDLFTTIRNASNSSNYRH